MTNTLSASSFAKNNTPYLPLSGVTATQLASDLNLEQIGENCHIDTLSFLTTLKPNLRALTFLNSEAYLDILARSEKLVIIAPKTLIESIPRQHTILVSKEAPQTQFYLAFLAILKRQSVYQLEKKISTNVQIAKTAIIHEHVVIEDGVKIGDYCVIHNNTYIEKNTHIKSHCCIGSDGFEPKTINGKPQIIPHAGGVWIGEGSHIGSQVCIDKGLFGEFTTIGRYNLLDNLVQIGHSVTSQENCSIAAAAVLCGSSSLERGVWIGPQACLLQQVAIGQHSKIGLAAQVISDIPAFVFATGSPARPIHRICICQKKLKAKEKTCPNCGLDHHL